MNISKDRVEAYYFGDPSQIGYKILFIKRASRLVEYKQYLRNVHEFGNIWQGVSGCLSGDFVTIIATGIGPSMAGDAVYALDRPGTICLFSGTCGGLSKNFEIGDYLVADQAICGDGYSLNFGHSQFEKVSSDLEMSASLKKQLERKSNHVHLGTTFTTSSVVRETDPDFWGQISEDVAAIEMSASAFYAAALATCKKAISYFWVTDLPRRGKSFFESLSPKDIQIKNQRYERSVSLDLELLSAIEV
jgi:uridine phosphorylase